MNTASRRFTAGMAFLLLGLFLILAVSLAAPRTARAAGVRYAAPTAQGSGNCSSWVNACTLQTALAQAQSGDEIWVKAGVHYPGAAGNRSTTFALKNGVALYGGFAGTETARNQRNWQANRTILSGDIDRNDINTDGNYIAETWNDIRGNNAYHVVTGNEANATAVLDGFIITAGQANGANAPDNRGSGMVNANGSPTLANVTFSGNTATVEGGGTYNESGNPTLTNVTFSGNQATYGGGIYTWQGAPTLTDVTFNGNAAGWYGGGMQAYYSNPTLTNVTFSNNTARFGGGMRSDAYNATLTNVAFSDNFATEKGGGLYHRLGNPTLNTVTFSGNTAAVDGGGMYNDSSNPTLTNVTFSGNAAAVDGGGMYNDGAAGSSNPTLADVTFSSNRATYGGGMYNASGSPTLNRVTFSGNAAIWYGGGMYHYGSSSSGDAILTNVIFRDNTAWYGGGMRGDTYSATLTNVTFSGNVALVSDGRGGSGGGIYHGAGTLTVTNAILWGNSAITGTQIHTVGTSHISYSDIQGCGGSGSWNAACGTDDGGNIDADPRFVDAVNGNLHLLQTSPAIDAGNNAAVPVGITTDLDGNPRFADISTVTDTGSGAPPIVDMGAYEAQPDTTPPVVVSITRADANPTHETSVRFRIAFSEAVLNVDTSDLSLSVTGTITGASMTGVVGSGAVYTVTVNTGSGGGTLRLDIPATATITDLVGNSLSGLPYTDGEVYEVKAERVRYAAPTAQGNGNCTSWANACALQTALAQAVNGDEIWVKAGVHYPGANRTDTFTLKNGVALYGGFAGTETARTQRDWQANRTILSGDIDQNDVNTDGNYIAETWDDIQGNNAYHVVTSNGVTETAVLDGFVITAGQANGNAPNNVGGGVVNVNGSPTLVNVTFSGNTTGPGGSGGGLHNESGNPALTNVTFDSNWAAYGGGMYTWQGAPTLTDVTFRSNAADWYGGGMQAYYSNPTLTDVTFISNTARFGGGMRSDAYSATLTNVTFSGNAALVSDGQGGSGGGLYHRWGDPTLTNVTFSGNTATVEGGGMVNNGDGGSSNPTLTNVTFSGNRATYGGGIYTWQGDPTLTNVTFSGNAADWYGGGMQAYYSNPTLTNVTFINNTARYGGGMHSDTYSATLTNVTFSGNAALVSGGQGGSGGGLYHRVGTLTLVNAILWGNSAITGTQIHTVGTSRISYSDIQGCGGSGSWNAACGMDGGGNMDADPRFLNAASGDLRLQLTSPAIDAGNNYSVTAGIVTDLDGNPRFVDIPTVTDTGSGTPPIVDMGAYEARYVDVALRKTVLPSTVAPGQPITFTLTLSNAGSLPVTGIVVTDTLPAWLWSASFTSNLIVTNTGYLPPYVWRVQDLAPGQSGVITVSGVLTLPLAAGTYTNTVLLSAADDLLAENNTAVITITVPNVAPVFTGAPVVTATQGASYTCTATARDDNGDALAITAPTLPSWLTLVDNGDGTATLSGTPTNAEVGQHPVVLLVTDSGGLTDTQVFTITVANNAPYFASMPVTTAAQGALYTYAVTADDPDLIHGDALAITAPTLPVWLSLVDHGDGTATLSGTPGDDDAGPHSVVLRVTDSRGAFAEQEFVIAVFEKPRWCVYLPLVSMNWRP